MRAFLNIASGAFFAVALLLLTAATTYGPIQPSTCSGSNLVNGVSSAGVISCVAPAAAGAGNSVGGRLTLQSGIPVMTARVAAATTVYYDCFSGGTVLVGGNALTIGSCEISMGLSASHFGDTVLQPYDVFAVDNSGTLVMCAGPQWSSSTARSTAIDQTSNGLWTNATSMTHCYGGVAGNTDYGTVGAHAGTLLGTIAPVAAGQTQMDLSRPFGGGVFFSYNLVSNAYNRVPLTVGASMGVSTWNVGSATWVSINGGCTCGILVIDSLGQSPYVAKFSLFTQSLSGNPEISIDNVQQCGGGFSPDLATVSGFPGGVSSELLTQKAGVLTLGGDVSDANNLFVPCNRTSFGNVTFGDSTLTSGTNIIVTADM